MRSTKTTPKATEITPLSTLFDEPTVDQTTMEAGSGSEYKDGSFEEAPALSRLFSETRFTNIFRSTQALSRGSSLEDVASADDSGVGSAQAWKQLALDFAGTLIAVILVSANCVSFAYSIFASNDQLMDKLSLGINMTIIGVIVSGLVLAYVSQVPWVVAGPDPFCIAFIYPMIQQIYGAMQAQTADGEAVDLMQFVSTCVVTIVLSSLVCGVGMLFTSFKALRIGDFIPYSVMCGLFTGMGLRLLQMGILMCTKEFTGLNQLFCAIAFGVADAVLTHFNLTWENALLFILAPVGFYICLAMFGISSANAEDFEWLFEANDVEMHHLNGWEVVLENGIFKVDFLFIFRICFSTMVIMTLFEVLKTTLIYRHSNKTLGIEIKHKREMRVSGVCNLASGLCGGFPTYMDMGASNFIKRIGASERRPGLLVAIIMFMLYLSPNSVLEYIPKFVFSGKLFSQGFQLVRKWAVEPFLNYFNHHWDDLRRMDLFCNEFVVRLIKRMAQEEFAIIPFISIICWLKGIPYMVAAGIAVSLALFIFRLYQVGNLKSDTDGLVCRSGIEREPEALEFLDRHGDRIRILKLQGFIFFGSAHKLSRRIRRILHYTPYTVQQTLDPKSVEARKSKAPKYLVLDCPNVTGVDTAAADIFVQVAALCQEQKCLLLFSGLNFKVKKSLIRAGLSQDDSRYLKYRDVLDEALGLAEDLFLQKVYQRIEDEAKQRWYCNPSGKGSNDGLLTCLERIQKNYHFNTRGLEVLSQHTEAIFLEKGSTLDLSKKGKKGLYFLELGYLVVHRNYIEDNQATVRTRTNQLKKHRDELRLQNRTRDTRFGPGWVIGCMEMASGQTGFSRYEAKVPCYIHFLAEEKCSQLQKTDAGTAMRLSELISRLIAYRCDHLKEQLSNMVDYPTLPTDINEFRNRSRSTTAFSI